MNNIGINGFGRIGRSILRIIVESNSDLNVIAINDLGDKETLSYLFKHDSIMGILNMNVEQADDYLIVGDRKIKLISHSDPGEIPWSDLGVDLVVESTGFFRDKHSLDKHISSGAKKVVLTVPPKDAIDATVVLGVNDNSLNPDDKLISNASCTTNCLAPIAKVLNDNFKIKSGLMTTVHAYTNDQALAETTHSDFRRGRNATQNIIPTSTGAAKAVGMVLPELNGKLDGFAIRVPTINVSIVDLCFNIGKKASIDTINNILKKASEGKLKNILGYNADPLVSIDFNHSSFSSIYDESLTRMMDDKFFKICAWYDNEWGFSNRMLDVTKTLMRNE